MMDWRNQVLTGLGILLAIFVTFAVLGALGLPFHSDPDRPGPAAH